MPRVSSSDSLPWPIFLASLRSRLATLGPREFVVLSFPAFGQEHYVQAVLDENGNLVAECSGCPAQEDVVPLPTRQQEMLLRIGWELPNSGSYGNYRASWAPERGSIALPAGDFEDAARLMTSTVSDIFRVMSPAEIEIVQDVMSGGRDLQPSLRRVLIDVIEWSAKQKRVIVRKKDHEGGKQGILQQLRNWETVIAEPENLPSLLRLRSDLMSDTVFAPTRSQRMELIDAVQRFSESEAISLSDDADLRGILDFLDATYEDTEEAEAGVGLPEELQVLLQLDTKSEGLDPAIVSSVCHHDPRLMLRLIRTAEEQVIVWRQSGDEAQASGDIEEARACRHEMEGWLVTVNSLRSALGHVTDPSSKTPDDSSRSE